MECSELRYGREKDQWLFPDLLMFLNLFVSYVRPPILHGSETLCLKESEMRIL